MGQLALAQEQAQGTGKEQGRGTSGMLGLVQ